MNRKERYDFMMKHGIQSLNILNKFHKAIFCSDNHRAKCPIVFQKLVDDLRIVYGFCQRTIDYGSNSMRKSNYGFLFKFNNKFYRYCIAMTDRNTRYYVNEIPQNVVLEKYDNNFVELFERV